MKAFLRYLLLGVEGGPEEQRRPTRPSVSLLSTSQESSRVNYLLRCIYMIDPSSIMTVAARRAQSSLPTKTRSETTVSYRTPPDLVPDTSSGDESDDEGEGSLTMSPAEIRVIRRLSARSNILPVIAHADSLTDDKLLAVKNAGL